MKRQFITSILTATLALSVSAWTYADETKPGEGRQRDPAAAFQRLDADGNGKLSKEEFKKLATLGQGIFKDRPEVLDRLFERLDADKDGALSLDEYKKIGGLRGRSGPPSSPAPTAAPAPQKSAAGKPVAPSAENYKKAADYSAQSGGRAVLVLVDGKTVFERYDNGSTADTATHLHSATKGFWGPVIAAMIEDKLIESYDELASKTLPEWKGDPRKSRITLRHLLTLSAGLEQDITNLQGHDSGDARAGPLQTRHRRAGAPRAGRGFPVWPQLLLRARRDHEAEAGAEKTDAPGLLEGTHPEPDWPEDRRLGA